MLSAEKFQGTIDIFWGERSDPSTQSLNTAWRQFTILNGPNFVVRVFSIFYKNYLYKLLAQLEGQVARLGP